MAESEQEKSRGLTFAEQQLLRHGWERGKGLGRAENGISEALKVKVKCDKGGVGHKQGEQFTFHWWDHVFNKASSSLHVASDQNGVSLKKTADDGEEDGIVSNKKPRKASLAKAKLYGCFVKSATLLSGQEQAEPKSSDSEDSSSSDKEDDQKLDLSSTTKLSDAELMKACGGRTAHKGARHGLTMSAKLARLEQQEAEFMAKYGKKNQPASASPVSVPPLSSQSAELRAERQEETDEHPQRKKMKKKRCTGSINELNAEEVSGSPETGVKLKKKKKKAKEEPEEITCTMSIEDHVCAENDVSHSHKTKTKRKKQTNVEQSEEERGTSGVADSRTQEDTDELHTDTKVKRKKSSKQHNEEEASHATEPAQDCVSKTKKKKAEVFLEKAEVTEESTARHKKKKCKKDKLFIDGSVNAETCPPKKKKKSKE